MAIERIIGVDFGTSTSVIRVKRYENGKPIVDGDPLSVQVVGEVSGELTIDPIPTVIQELNGHSYYGIQATTKHRGALIYRGFKVDLESDNEEKRSNALKLTESFMKFLADKYKTYRESGKVGKITDKERTIISYPVKWSESTRDFMVSAARRAGFPNVEGMDEAKAAIQAAIIKNEESLQSKGYIKENIPVTILLIDMGAGTTDLALCRYTPGKQPEHKILSTWPKDTSSSTDGKGMFGGQEVDQILYNYAYTLFENQEEAKYVVSKIPISDFKEWKEKTVSRLLADNIPLTTCTPVDNIVDTMETFGQIINMKPCYLDCDAFEKLAEEYLKQFPKLVAGCLQDANMQGAQVDLVILTGGHSQWYFAKDILTGKMPHIAPALLPQIALNPARIIQNPMPYETVAAGLVYSGFFDHNDEFSPEVVTELLNTNPTEAREYLRKYAEQGVAVAQWIYADCFWFAVGGERDIKAAHSWYKKAAEQGIAEAFLGLANIHFNEKDKEHYDLETATEYLKKAADLGHVPAQFALACTYSRSERYDKALKYFEMAAEQGHISAQYFTGYQYYIGYGTKVDFSSAIKWLRKTIENPNEGPNAVDNPTESKIGALKLLGDAYEHGKGVPADMNKANTYYRQAKELEGLAEDEAAGSKQVDDDGKKIDIADFYRKQAKELLCSGWVVCPDGRCINIHRNGKVREASGIKKLFYHANGYVFGITKDGEIDNIAARALDMNKHNQYNQMMIDKWTDVVDVASSSEHTVGLLRNGTAVAVGRDHKGQCNVGHWSNIVQLCCKHDQTAGLKSDGTVVTTYGDKDIEKWKDIVSICYPSFGSELYALRKDGTILNNAEIYQGTYSGIAKHVKAIVPCDVGVFALLDDGTVWKPKTVFSAAWRNVISIAAGSNFVAGLRSDGTVVAEGKNDYGQCNVDTWRDVIAISTHPNSLTLYALRKDGRIYYTSHKKEQRLFGEKVIPDPQGTLTSYSIFDISDSAKSGSDVITSDDLTQGATFDMSDIDL